METTPPVHDWPSVAAHTFYWVAYAAYHVIHTSKDEYHVVKNLIITIHCHY